MQRHWSEVVAMRRLGFAYLEKVKPYEWAAAHASRLLKHQPEHTISAGYLLDEEIVISIAKPWIDQLNSHNLIVLIACQAPPHAAVKKKHEKKTTAKRNTPPWQSALEPR